jgi:hypothetical protein
MEIPGKTISIVLAMANGYLRGEGYWLGDRSGLTYG